MLLLLLLAATFIGAGTVKAEAVQRVHLDGYDVPLGVPGGDILNACVIDLHQQGTISTVAYVGECTDVLPRFKEKLESDGVTTIVSLSINGHNINLT